MQGDAAKDLHVVVHHVPFHLVSAGRPLVVVDGFVAVDGDKVVGRVGGELAVEVGGRDHHLVVLGKAACSVLDNAVGCGHHLVENLLQGVEHFLVLLVDFVEDGLAFVDGRVLDAALELGYFVEVRLGGVLHVAAHFPALGAQFVVAEFLDVGIDGLHLLHKGLDKLHVSA